MNKQQIQHVLGNLWFWLGISLLLIVAMLAIQNISQRKAATLIPNTGAAAPAIQAQSVPEAGVQGVANYIDAHNSNSSAQAVPEAAVQSVTDYLKAHGGNQAQSVPEAAVQSVMDYLHAHGVK
ncbi:MAG: hypothetical protein ABI986_05475 [Chloroflexota bacterium]